MKKLITVIAVLLTLVGYMAVQNAADSIQATAIRVRAIAER